MMVVQPLYYGSTTTVLRLMMVVQPLYYDLEHRLYISLLINNPTLSNLKD